MAQYIAHQHRLQSGSIPIAVLIFLPMLLVMMGLGADIGKLYVAKAELQNAADACALAAAAKLDGSATQYATAITAGTTVATQNKVAFQNDLVTTDANTVQFGTSADGPFSAAAPLNATFVQCSVSKAGIANWITPLLNRIGGSVAATESVAASAVATTIPGQTTCALPIGVCNTDLAGKTPGQWIEGILSPGGGGPDPDQTLSGSFRWVDLTAGGGGASELADILSGAAPESCSISTTDPYIGEQGFKASLRASYNTRFGIKRKTASPPFYPDFSGKGYYNVLQQNRYASDFINARASFTPYSDIAGINISNAFDQLSTSQHQTYGTSRRVAITPVVDCATMELQSFACVFLLHPLPTSSSVGFTMYLEYLGNPGTGITPCNTSAFAGSGSGPRVSALVK